MKLLKLKLLTKPKKIKEQKCSNSKEAIEKNASGEVTAPLHEKPSNETAKTAPTDATGVTSAVPTNATTTANARSGKRCKIPKQILISAIVAVLALIGLIVTLIFILRSLMENESSVTLPEVEDTTEKPKQRTFRIPRPENDPCSRTCLIPELMKPHPPLILISFDGYAKYYLRRKLQPTFDKIAKCGVTAERVYPSFPSLTFPNHVTISNGRYPGNHGIVANYILDRNISNFPRYLGYYFVDEFYKVEPIWSLYKRHTGRSVGTFAWLGSYHKSSYYIQPDHRVTFQRKHDINDRFETIIKWLQMDSSNRPGLMMAYITQPDHTGHKRLGKPMNQTLKDVDQHLGNFLEKLDDEGFLGCVNLVLVSDHGMTRLYDHLVLSDYVNVSDYYIITGPQSQIYLKNSSQKVEDVLDKFSCKTEDRVRVFTKTTMPVRFHYSNSSRIGDVVLLGKHGTQIALTPETIKLNSHAAHGFDYIERPIHTIMYARGPDFKENYVLPAFQNVEYMNLFTKLLRIPLQFTDGDPWFMDLALANYSTHPKDYESIEYCVSLAGADVPHVDLFCGNCSDKDKFRIAEDIKCSTNYLSLALTLESDWSNNFCTMTSCDELAVINNSGTNAFSGALVEIYNESTNANIISKGCDFELSQYHEQCLSSDVEDGFEYSSLSAYPGKVMGHERSLVVLLKSRFIADFLEPLNDYTRTVVKRFGQVLSITGTAFDEDYDGAFSRTPPRSASPTHIFRILITCKEEWSKNGPYCAKPENTRALSFILPHIESDPNCLKRDEFLLQYSARIKDVETISGLRFNFFNIPHMQRVLLRLYTNTNLW